MKRMVILIIALLILAAAAFCAWRWFDNTYIMLGSEPIRRDSTQFVVTDSTIPTDAFFLELHDLSVLDARNVTLSPAEYDRLQQLLPNCEILWQIPFQGQSFPHDVKELNVNTLSPEDLRIIPYFRSLQTVHAESCRDYEMIMALQEACPDLDVRYSVTVCGNTYSQLTAPNVTHLVLQNANIQELAAALPCFPYLQEVRFTGTAPEHDAIYMLMCQYPNISFQWELNVCGVTTMNSVETLILSGIPMANTDEVESALKYFPNLKKIEMCDCGISSDEMGALSQRHPDIKFVWNIKIRHGTLRTDATAFIPIKLGYHMFNPLYDADCTELKYCTDLICLDMGHMRVEDLSFLRNMPKLKYLIVADTPCRDFTPLSTLTELIYLEIFVTSFTDHELLLGMTKLEDLNIGTTPATDVSALHKMPWLKRLWMPGTKINADQLRALQEALPNTTIVRHAEHSTANGWRHHQNYRDMRDMLDMFYMD